jgi:hypothetical protein
MRRNARIAAVAILDLAILWHLAGSFEALAMFAAFVVLLVVPALALTRRIAPMPVAALIVVVAFVPWFFARKASGMPLIVDLVTAAILIATAIATRSLKMPSLKMPVVTFVFVPLLFAIVWLGWNAPNGNEVRDYGLFAVDFGNLASVVSTLRASPGLPLSYVAGMGPLSYHWLYFTIPASLADAFDGAMPNGNALVLANLLAAILLVQTVATFAGERRAALLVLFAPFTSYFYQAVAARVALGPLALPTRNHLLLSPLNSMRTFGNNTIALVLIVTALLQLERWNHDGRLRDALFGSVAMALVIGYSVTLVFPLIAAVALWAVSGRIRRPLVVIPLAALTGFLIVALFFALGILTRGGARHIAVAFDHGQFFRMVAFGLVPLWGVALLAWRRMLTIEHILIACCVAVPSLLYIAGSPTGASDFSMKTASLIAIAFAPLLVFDGLTRRRVMMAIALAVLGIVQTSAYVLQFPYYRLTHSSSNGVGLPRDYAEALTWIRDHTPRAAIVVDPHELPDENQIFTLILAERRVWLPARYTGANLPPELAARVAAWNAFAAGDKAAGRRIAAEADYLIVRGAIVSTDWREVRRGTWSVFQSAIRKPQVQDK